MRDTPGGHTCYIAEWYVCVEQKPNHKRRNMVTVERTKEKVNNVTGSANISIDGRESQVNKERVNQ